MSLLFLSYPCAFGARSLLSLFIDPEQILRRLYIFAEEPCKSTITTSEPCSPVFKEAQPRPSKQSISLISRIGNFIVHNVFLLLVIYCCNKASNRIVTKSKELVFYSWIPLSPEVSRLSPFTHAKQHTLTSRTFYIFVVHQPKPTIITLHWPVGIIAFLELLVLLFSLYLK